jgi:predicted MPP superfamily phosphohydrolase
VSEPHRSLRVPPRVAVKLALYLLGCWTLVAVLVAGYGPLALAVVIALAVYTSVPLVVFLRSGGWPRYPGKWFRLLVVRVFWYVQLSLPLVTVAGALGIIVGAFAGSPVAGGRVGAGIVLVGLCVLFAAGYFGSRRLVRHELVASIPNLPPEFEGARIAQISDLHVGPHTSRRFLARIRAMLGEGRPDLIAITGDLVDDRWEDVAIFARELGPLRAPLGVYVIAGNHDVYADWEAVEHELAREDVGTLLLNAGVVVRRGAAGINVLGTGDPAGRMTGSARVSPDVARTLASRESGLVTIALAHNPALWPQLADAGVELTLSGHTHWGQFAIPRLRWSLASVFLEHAMGAYARGNSLLYITPGTGVWGLPLRVGATCEVAFVTLRRGPAAIRTTSRR